MPIIVPVDGRWERQPAGPVKPAPTGLGRNIQMLLIPQGGQLVDVAAERIWTPNGNASIATTTNGMAASFDGNGDYFSATGYEWISGAVGTFFCWAPRVGVADTNGQLYLHTTTTNNVFFQVDAAANNKIYCFGQEVTSAGTSSGYYSSTNRSVVMSADGTAASKRFFLDGAQGGSASGVAPTAFASGSKTFRFGGALTGTTWDVDADIVVAGFTRDVWGPAEARAFHSQPWQLFRKRAARFFLLPAAAGGTAVDQATETDTAQAIAAGQSQAVGLVSETDSAQSISASASVAIGQTSETDAAQSLASQQSIAVGQATETDAAQPIDASGGTALGIPTETDAAQTIASAQSSAIGLTTETDAAQSVSPSASIAIGLVSETDAAQAITIGQSLGVGLVAESDTAMAITITGGVALQVVAQPAGGGHGRPRRDEDDDYSFRDEEDEVIMLVAALVSSGVLQACL